MTKPFRLLKLSLIFVGLAALVSAYVPTTTAAAAPATTASATTAKKPVVAFYYLWWDASHWQNRLGPNYPYSANPLPLPATLSGNGCTVQNNYVGNHLTDAPAQLFTQDDPNQIKADVTNAAAAGLTGFAVGWLGTGQASQTASSSALDQRLASLVAAVHQINSAGTPFSLWISYMSSASIRTQAQMNADLTYLSTTYGTDSAFNHQDGRPVLMMMGSWKYSQAFLDSMSATNRPHFYLVGDENWNTWSSAKAADFDADSTYWSSQDPVVNPASFSQIATLATAVRSTHNPDGTAKQFFAPMAPGYNKLLDGGTNCIPRLGGQTMQALYAGNAKANPDGWMVISWNEIDEGTYVTPLQRYGMQSLNTLSPIIAQIQAGTTTLTTAVIIPKAGATLSGTTYLDAAVPGAVVATTTVKYLLSGGSYSDKVIGTATPTYYGWLFLWNSTTVPDGSYTVRTEAFTSAGSAFSPSVSFTVANGSPPPPPTGHKVIVLLEENHGIAASTAGMPYLTSLGSTFGNATGYTAISHPSLPNYLALFGGSTYGTSSDCGVGCGPTGSTDRSVWDQTIAAGKAAKAYQQSMTSACQTGGQGAYAPRHGPWPYWTNAISRANCVANDVPLTALQPDITAGHLPITGEITPDLQNDAHDGTLAQADAFLKTWVPALMAGPDYKAGNLTIIITFDENGGSAGNGVQFVAIDPRLSGKVVGGSFNHYSLTKWLEDNAGVTEQNNAAAAANLKTAFGL
jgi:hypothetical protein